ncbi:cyclophane-forming radical SAM/SPASM peptide maturase GrrM/OscB [Roseobacter sp.]|uniref:cyclophane-forming radical SAM/SPASM peptide maturase GrrM/OscB n=1 Tax=Roseobacter sp. TaxID=1907202 RepID=UPI003297FD90
MEQLEQLVKLLEQLEQLGKLVTGQGGPSLLVLQPTSFCNLDCSYCYLQHRDVRARMSHNTLRAIARNILAQCPQNDLPVIVWHGGEPMTLPPDWYAAAFALLERESGKTGLRHAMQTNAIGVNADWIALWQKWQVNIGVSLDGPQDLHDARRHTRTGAGTHHLVMRGVSRLQAAGVPFHVISVLTADSLPRADDFYDFYTGHGLRNVAFNVEEDEGQPGGSSLGGHAAASAAYAGFLRRFLARCAADPEPFFCREVDGVLGVLTRPHSQRAENWQTAPFRILAVAVDGGLSTFSPELMGAQAPAYDDFIFGNVRQGGVATLLDSPAFHKAYEEISRGVRACADSCAYFDVCGGGAPANKYFELGRFDGTQTLHCSLTRQVTLDVVLDAVERGQVRHPILKGGRHDHAC